MPALAETEPRDEVHVAAVLGLHLVTEILDEACTIAQASQNIGWPWTCVLSVFRDAKNNKLPAVVPADDSTFVISQNNTDSEDDVSVTQGNISVAQGDSVAAQGAISVAQGDTEVSEEEKDPNSNVVTSTPHKVEATKVKQGNSLIGQGDEEIDMRQEELNNSTSMFINHLFDMSDVEKEGSHGEAKTAEAQPKINSNIVDVVTDQIVEIVDLTSGQVEVIEVVELEEDEQLNIRKESCFTFLADAYDGDVNNNGFYVDDDVPSNKDEIEVVCVEPVVIEETEEKDMEDKTENNDVTHFEEAYIGFNRDYEPGSDDDGYPILQDLEEIVKKDDGVPTKLFKSIQSSPESQTSKKQSTSRDEHENSDVARYEDAYLTLNRDYEPGSDDEGYPILQDPKELVMQDVELLTTESSEDNHSSHHELEEERKKLAATSAVSGASAKSRSSLMSKCRSQGARLLSCLRGWWRRKTPGKRKARTPGSVRGMCPLSPSARRRAASLLDHRHLHSPAPSSAVVWKFNTVNEALVNSSRWKEYTFEIKPEAFDEE